MSSAAVEEPPFAGATDTPARAWGRQLDLFLAVLLVAVVIGYLVLLPLNLQSSDEARHLDHARRILDGEVLYRDVFEITTPGWVFLMAAMFAAFGTTLHVARMTVAVVHACTAVTLFASCRWLGVRRELAWTCALTSVFVGQRIFPNASYHWLATLICAVILLLCLVTSRAPWWAFATGIALGLLVAVHQQRGAGLSVAIGGFWVAQWAVDRLHGRRLPFALLLRQLLAIGAGILVVMVPLLAVTIAMAGIGPVWKGLVTATMVNYRNALYTPWGNSWGGYNEFVAVARAVPFALIPTVAIAGALCWRRTDPEAARQHMLLTLFGLGSLLSIAYFPDIVHLGLVTPIFLVMTANLVERLLRLLPRRIDPPLGLTMAAVVLIAVGLRAYRNVIELQAMFPVPYESAFGRVDLGGKGAAVGYGNMQKAYYEQLRRLVDSSPDRTLYVHPKSIYTHLVVGARNPTRYDLVAPPIYTTPEQMQEVVDALATSRVRYILWFPLPVRAREFDIVGRYIAAHYEKTSDPGPLAPLLWVLKPSASPAPAAIERSTGPVQ